MLINISYVGRFTFIASDGCCIKREETVASPLQTKGQAQGTETLKKQFHSH